MIYAQHTLGWYRARLGTVTGSNLGKLMTSGRTKGKMFSDTGMAYIYQLAAERAMNPAIVNDDTLFEEYLNQTDVTSKAMRWGTEQEPNARALYVRITKNYICETGLCKHKTIENFASSPDGFFYDENSGERGVIEVKCFDQKKHFEYANTILDSQSMFEVDAMIYYQCMAHIMCIDAAWCDFVLYNPYQLNPIHIVRIPPNEEVFDRIKLRVNDANNMINVLIKN
jgi:hypothetical protein